MENGGSFRRRRRDLESRDVSGIGGPFFIGASSSTCEEDGTDDWNVAADDDGDLIKRSINKTTLLCSSNMDVGGHHQHRLKRSLAYEGTSQDPRRNTWRYTQNPRLHDRRFYEPRRWQGIRVDCNNDLQRPNQSYGASQGYDSRFKHNKVSFFDPLTVPAGWLNCPPYGDSIGYLIPSKVPLSEAFNKNISRIKRYTPNQAIYEQRCLCREIGLVIDLTNTFRYYPESDWTSQGIRYVKIRCPGMDFPDDESINRFIDEVTKFKSQPENANKYVFLHCTHGYNRTGYMIVHFLVRIEKITVTEAIAKFSNARSPGIYKKDYIDALYRSYLESKPELVVYPKTPEWKKQPDRREDATSPSHNTVIRASSICNDALRDRASFGDIEKMRYFCNSALDLHVQGITEVTHHYTLLDGAMEFNTEQETQEKRRYIIYDVITINEVSVAKLPLHERLMLIEDEVFKPRNYERDLLCKGDNAYYQYDLEPFEVRRKEFYHLSASTKLVKEFLPFLSYATDGLLFQAWNDAYRPWAHEGLLKWKYPRGYTVDFLFKVGVNDDYALYLQHYGRNKQMDGCRVEFRGKILECSWDPKRGIWVFVRTRRERLAPDSVNTYEKVKQRMEDEIATDTLLSEISEVLELPIYSESRQDDWRFTL
nr:mRNA-capping enzyme-like isoform X1 [Ipomoea batatas]